MKRSEVLSIIEKHVSAIRKGAMLGLEYDPDYANNILRALEEVGILPPFNYHERDKNANTVCKEASFYAEWEPENE